MFLLSMQARSGMSSVFQAPRAIFLVLRSMWSLNGNPYPTPRTGDSVGCSSERPHLAVSGLRTET